MLKQSGILADFEAICGEYGLPAEGGNYYFLLDTFTRKRSGMAYTIEEILEDDLALELAEMLKQLSSSFGGFSLQTGAKKDYKNPALVEVLKEALEAALQGRVEKGREHMILSKGYGSGGDQGRAFIIPYPEGSTPQEKGFSKEELEAIITYEKEQRGLVEKMKGNVKNYSAPTRNPELGKLVVFLKQYLPEEWNEATQNSFLADYLCGAGFLDFKGKAWLDGFRDKLKAEKDRQVRDWINSYKRVR